MTFLGRFASAALAFGIGSLALAPSAHAMLRAAVGEDLTAENSLSPSPPSDASPSIVATVDGQWIAWSRIPADFTRTDWSFVMLSRATLAGGVDHTPADLPRVDSLLYDVSVSHDGASPVVVYTRGSTDVNAFTEIALWHPLRAAQLTVTGFSGRSLDLNSAPYVDHGLIPFVVSYSTGTGTAVPTSVQYYLTCDGSYGSCMFTQGVASTTYFDGRAAVSSGQARYLMSRNDGGNAALQVIGSDLAAVPNSRRVLADFITRDTGETIAFTGTGATSVRLSRVDTAGTVSLALPAPITTASTVNDLALAVDRSHTAWMGVLENGGSQIEIIAEDDTSTLVRVMLHAPSAFPHCQRMHMAPFAADPDAVAVVAQCIDGTNTLGHIFYWVVRRQPDIAADAGTDVALVDVPVEDVIDVVTSTDVATSDVQANDVVDAGADATDDSSTALDVVVNLPGTGPGFRGSGCNCTVPAAPREGHGRAALVAIGLAAVWMHRRRARSS